VGQPELGGAAVARCEHGWRWGAGGLPGGGGGGLFGGRGGGGTDSDDGDCGGGGGSSFAVAGATGVTCTTGANPAGTSGSVLINYTAGSGSCAPPALVVAPRFTG
jgi:hypothetical protein